jgi:hypothetical protein
MSYYYRVEVELFQNVFFCTDVIGTRRACVVETDSVPLVDRESFISVHEPGDVAKPIEVDGHRTIAEKETAKEQQRDDEWWA